MGDEALETGKPEPGDDEDNHDEHYGGPSSQDDEDGEVNGNDGGDSDSITDR